MPKIVDHDKRRSDLLDHAFSLFAKNGYHGVSVRQIAKSVGMTTGMLYHYFPNKPDLFKSLLNQMQSRQINDFESSLRQHEDGSVALALFVQKEQQAMQNLLSIAIDFRRVHPEIDISDILDPYESVICSAMRVPKASGRQMLSTILGELTRGLLGPTEK